MLVTMTTTVSLTCLQQQQIKNFAALRFSTVTYGIPAGCQLRSIVFNCVFYMT